MSRLWCRLCCWSNRTTLQVDRTRQPPSGVSPHGGSVRLAGLPCCPLSLAPPTLPCETFSGKSVPLMGDKPAALKKSKRNARAKGGPFWPIGGGRSGPFGGRSWPDGVPPGGDPRRRRRRGARRVRHLALRTGYRDLGGAFFQVRALSTTTRRYARIARIGDRIAAVPRPGVGGSAARSSPYRGASSMDVYPAFRRASEGGNIGSRPPAPGAWRDPAAGNGMVPRYDA
jgi:hypothetical protein